MHIFSFLNDNYNWYDVREAISLEPRFRKHSKIQRLAKLNNPYLAYIFISKRVCFKICDACLLITITLSHGKSSHGIQSFIINTPRELKKVSGECLMVAKGSINQTINHTKLVSILVVAKHFSESENFLITNCFLNLN